MKEEGGRNRKERAKEGKEGEEEGEEGRGRRGKGKEREGEEGKGKEREGRALVSACLQVEEADLTYLLHRSCTAPWLSGQVH